jgi:carboxylesterase 2/para-nitrobenzyl esterase
MRSMSLSEVRAAATATRVGRRLAEELGVPATRAAIAAASPERVLRAQAKMRDDLQARPDPAFWGEVALTYLPWAPTVDGQTIPKPPIEAIRAGVAADTDLLVGSITEETRLFLLSYGTIDRLTGEALAAMAVAYGLPAEGLSAYRAAHPGASAGELFSAIQTDWYWRIPAVRLADEHAAGARAATYMYEFASRSPQMGGRLGAAHAVEIPFVFDTLGLGTEPMLGVDPPQTLTDAMHRAWVAFAAQGDRGWPRYDAARRRAMHFDTESGVVDNPLARALAVWLGVR